MKIHGLAGETHFLDHLAPIWPALPESMRGPVHVYRGHAGVKPLEAIMEHGRRLGLNVTTDRLPSGAAALVASWGDHKRARQASAGRIAVMPHGIDQTFADDDHPSYAGGRNRQDASLFLTPNEHGASRWRAAYPQTRVEVAGLPLLDALPHRTPGPGPVVALTFHWPAGHVPEARGAFEEYKRSLPALAERYTLIGTAHPRMLGMISRFYERVLKAEVVEDFAEVCRRSDLLIADTNSAPYLFAGRRNRTNPTGYPVVLLNRPPTFGRMGIVTDPGYRKDQRHGLRFWDAAGVGVNCDWPDLLMACVEEALRDTPERQAARVAALKLVFPIRSGSAAKYARALTSWTQDAAEAA
jgi:hypothetical protein